MSNNMKKILLEGKEVDSLSLSDYLHNLWKYGEQLFQVICLAAEDAGTTSPLPSDRLRTSVIRQVTELCTRKSCQF